MAYGETYEEFVEKFKPKHTTDDCLTPDYIYDVVVDYVERTYGIDRSKFIRPFWPGANYETAEYPEGCVVVDNPPFSLSTKILKFYNDRNIKYFLFCSHLTAMSPMRKNSEKNTVIGVGYPITYENGAIVNTSFFTNMEPRTIARSEPELYATLKAVEEKRKKEQKATLPKYIYPDCILTSPDLTYMAKNGVRYTCNRASAAYIKVMDSQRKKKKAIFGGGLLISEKAAAEKTAAEKAAAEKTEHIVWELSEREKEIVRSLDKT